MLCVILWAIYILSGKILKGYSGIYQHLAANGQQVHQICPLGENCSISLHIAVMWRYTLHLQWAVAEDLYISCTAVLFMYFSPHECPVAAFFLYNYQQWIGSDLTWLPLENKCPNYLFMSFSELELALFNICNMYSNTMHLCILFEECLTCCTNDRYNFLFFLEYCNISTCIVMLVLDLVQAFHDLLKQIWAVHACKH